MDLCSRDYGFFYVPALSVFLNPWSRFGAVSDEIVNMRDSNIDDFLRAHGEEATRDLLSRVSALFHERKHFHDVLFTPFGHYLFRLAFRAVLGASVLFMDTSWRRSRTMLPLQPEDVAQPELVNRTTKYLADFQQALASGKMLLEASATLAQLQHLWTVFGPDYKLLVEEHVGEVPEYRVFLDRAEALGYRLTGGHGESPGQLFHRLLLISLGSDSPPGGARSHDEALDALLKRLEAMSPIGFEARYRSAISAGWEVVERNIETSQRDDYQALETVERVAASLGDDIGRPLVAVFRDFVSKSHEFQRRALSDPGTYLQLQSYNEVGENAIFPLTYYYSADDSLSIVTASISLPEDAFYSRATYPNPKGQGEVHSYRVMPAYAGANFPTLDRKPWVDFLKLCGVLALIDDVDWLHPVSAYWLRTTGERMGITFRRRV